MAKGRMPEGTHPPSYIARGMDLKPKKSVGTRNSWDEGIASPEYRRKLLSAVRRGDPSAIRRLKEEFRCRIWYEHDV